MLKTLFLYGTLFLFVWFIGYVEADESFAELYIEESNIEDIVTRNNSIWLKLKPDMANKLKVITSKNVGKKLYIFLHEEIKVAELTVSVTIDSGVIHIAKPSCELMQEANTIIKAREKRKAELSIEASEKQQ